MIVMRPIAEPAVVEDLNRGRFAAPEGYVVMDGPNYLGYGLFAVEGDVVQVLDCGGPVTETANGGVLDGLVRACAAAGQDRGATSFCVNTDNAALAHWWQVFCPGKTPPLALDEFFGGCAHE